MQRGTLWMERLALKAEMEEELLPGQSLVELFGAGRVLIEHHLGVTAFACDEICIKMKYGILQICGQRLEMEKMSNEMLVITGRVDSLRIVRRC